MKTEPRPSLHRSGPERFRSPASLRAFDWRNALGCLAFVLAGAGLLYLLHFL